MKDPYVKFPILYTNSIINDMNATEYIIFSVIFFVIIASLCLVLVIHVNNQNKKMLKYETAREELKDRQKRYLVKKKNLEDYNKLMELQSVWRESKSLIKLGENDEYVISLAKEKGITPSLFIELQENNIMKYEKYHKEYNNKYNVNIPFPTK